VGAAVLGERLSRQMGRAAATLTLMAVWGIVAVTAVKVVGHLFGGIPMGGFGGGGLVFLANVSAIILTCIGAGSLLSGPHPPRAWPRRGGPAPPAPPPGAAAPIAPPVAPPGPPPAAAPMPEPPAPPPIAGT